MALQIGLVGESRGRPKLSEQPTDVGPSEACIGQSTTLRLCLGIHQLCCAMMWKVVGVMRGDVMWDLGCGVMRIERMVISD